MLVAAGLVALPLAGMQGGCAGTTETGMAYQVGLDREVTAELAVDLPTVHATALDVVEGDFHYTVTEEAWDARDGVIRATTALRHVVRIETHKRSETVTAIQVFVGPLGDREAAIDIITHVEDRLFQLGWLDA
jgi:hypothetical protein